MDGRVAGPEGGRPADQQLSSLRIPLLDCHDAQEMERVRVIGVLRQGRLIDTSGPLDVSPPMFLQGLAQVDWHHFAGEKQDSPRKIAYPIIPSWELRGQPYFQLALATAGRSANRDRET